MHHATLTESVIGCTMFCSLYSLIYFALHIHFNFLDLPSSVCEEAPINSKLIGSVSNKQPI